MAWAAENISGLVDDDDDSYDFYILASGILIDKEVGLEEVLINNNMFQKRFISFDMIRLVPGGSAIRESMIMGIL